MFNHDPHHYPYLSQRMATYARNGMVACSQPLAAEAGLSTLKAGGNAVDAAIAAAAALTVVEPTGCGMGGDAFALVWHQERLHGLNASGPSPRAINAEDLISQGRREVPLYGWSPVTVPGCVAGWVALSQRFGVLPFEQLMAPAIELADSGFPVSPTISRLWQRAVNTYGQQLSGELKAAFFEAFSLEGRAPEPGEVFYQKDQARTLRLIADSEGEAFYRGELADLIDDFSRRTGGYLRGSDLADYQCEWVDPIKVNYRGFDVWEIPPNGQGLVALMALNILQGFEFPARDTLDTFHRQIEAMKLAYVDGQKYITQAQHMSVSVDALLSDDYAKKRRSLIGEQALDPFPGKPSAGGTVYLATADRHGHMVSFIQSNYHGFGSGVVVPNTGITLQNRGNNFSLDPAHDNFLQPRKKTYHTIIPGFLTRNGQACGPFGVMGGFMQPQGHVQVLMNMIDFHLNPQAALDAPRWQWMEKKTVGIEHQVPLAITQGLAQRGHDIQLAYDRSGFGRGQIILRDLQSGVYCGGTEARTDGHIAIY